MAQAHANEKLVTQVARKVLTKSLGLTEGKALAVETWNNGLFFAKRVVVEARKIGVMPLLIFEDEDIYVESVRNTQKEFLGKMGKHEYGLLSNTDAYLFIPGPILGGSSRLTRKELVASIRYNESWYEAAKQAKLRGVRLTFGWVGQDVARALGKTVDEIAQHQLKASLVDFSEVRSRARKVASLLKDGSRVRILSKAGTLELALKGEEEIDDGVIDEDDISKGQNMTNVPPGQVVKEVDPDSLSGSVQFTVLIPRLGIVSEITLNFEHGVLQSWRSNKAMKWLNQLIQEAPVDRRRVSAISIGLNPSIRYGYGQDRFVEGAVTLYWFGPQGTVRRGSLTIDDNTLVRKGKLLNN